MTLNTLRYLDRKIGIPLCYFFYFVKKSFFLHGRHKFKRDKIKKILVIKIWGMGSIILASPLFKNLRDNFPDAEIWFLTKEGFENIYPSLFFDRIETMKLRGILRAIPDFLAMVWKFRREKFDLVIDLEIASRYTALLCYLSGAKIKVGFEIMGQNKDKLYDYRAVYHESHHVSHTFLNTLKILGINVKMCAFFPPEICGDDDKKSNALLKEKGISGRYIVVNINASELSYERRLPHDFFKLILSEVADSYPDYSLVFIGSENEKEYIGNFLKKFMPKDKNIFDLSGSLSLRGLFSIIKNASLVISNDSGPAHVASAFERPLIVFFGPETPVIYGPLNENAKIFYADIPCSPCISIYRDKIIQCEYNQKCLRSLDADEVSRAVKSFLK